MDVGYIPLGECGKQIEQTDGTEQEPGNKGGGGAQALNGRGAARVLAGPGERGGPDPQGRGLCTRG